MVSLARQSTTQGADLLRQYLASGSPDAFAAIMRAYGGMVYGVCLRVTKDPHDAEDASQAVFLTLAVQCRTGAKINYLGPWLQKVGKRVALDLVRSRKRRNRRETVSAQNGPQDEPGSQHVETDNGEVHQVIRAELDALPSRYRLPLVMHYFGGLSHDELAKELSCTPNTLGVRLHRGRKMLGERLSARGISLDSITLGLMLAAVVRTVVSDHCVSATAAAATQLASGSALSACFHPADPNVVHLIQQVALAGPRARLKFAAVTVALAATALAGTGEVWRRASLSAQPVENLMPRVPIRIPTERYLPQPRLDETAAGASAGHAPPAITHRPPMLLPLPDDQDPTPLTPPVTSAWQPKPLAIAEIVTSSAAADAAGGTWSDVPIQRDASGATLPFWNNVAAQDHPGSTSVRPSIVTAAPVPAAAPNARVAPPAVVFAPPPVSTGGSSARPREPITAIRPSAALPPPPSQFAAGPRNPTRAGATALAAADSLTTARSPDYLTTAVNPAIPIKKGFGTYTWNDPVNHTAGPSNATTAADIDFSVYDAKNAGYITIRTVDRIDSTIPPLPIGHTFINFWQFESSVDYAQISLSVRYDIELATNLGLHEEYLKLWVYDGGWRRINDETFSRDLINHRLTGTVASGELFAVSAPEPTSIFGIVGACGALLLRRRRRAA